MTEGQPQAIDLTRARKIRRERFLKVAERRTVRLIKDIRQLSKCANKSSYDYTQHDVSEIFDTIQDELDRAKTAFTGEREVRFRLSNREEVTKPPAGDGGT